MENYMNAGFKLSMLRAILTARETRNNKVEQALLEENVTLRQQIDFILSRDQEPSNPVDAT